jgi:CRP-like cAMP-binding protein
MKTMAFAPGMRVFAQGDYSEEAYLILEGSVQISIGEGSSKVVLATLGVGEIFGEMGMIECSPRSANACALDPLKVEVITAVDFNHALSDGGDILVPFLTNIFKRLRVMNDRLSAAQELLERQANSSAQIQTSRHDWSEPISGGLILQPDSKETRADSTLHEQVIITFPFVFGRRDKSAASVDVFSKTRLLINDDSADSVSPWHCMLEHEKGLYFVQDLGSQFGTIVNGVALGGSSEESRLRLRTGQNTLVLGAVDSVIRFILRVPEG